MKVRILLADDEDTFRETFSRVLVEEGFEVTTACDGLKAIDAIRKDPYDVVILDIQMPGADGIKVLRETMSLRPDTRVIMVTAFGTVEMAVEAIKLGASEYVMKPVIFEDVILKIEQQSRYRQLQQENTDLKTQLDGQFSIDSIIGDSPSMKHVFETIYKVSGARSNVLITGESGTGKEMVARAIHATSSVSSSRFIAINCGAIPEGLLESELFGHVKGSFTGAHSDKKGLFEAVGDGTLFLDEIGHMPLSCQVKLLRAVEDREIWPVGATEPIEIRHRLVAATNKKLLDEIDDDKFREDLYYRLNVVGIHLPPLRERRDDIPKLVRYFVEKYNSEMGKNCVYVNDDVMQVLMDYEWKGNIRELQNVIERSIIFAEGDTIKVSDIGIFAAADTKNDNGEYDLHHAVRSYERQYIIHVLDKFFGNKAQAAKALGVGLSSLYRKIDELNINGSKKIEDLTE
ncbi:MAG: sigma-54-dependent Fis family transcriptional regulator [Planctomycetes bacterium]|nr:sigma-54-dependent Fis family transcriptional regulator [Planctomycetota bacterium]